MLSEAFRIENTEYLHHYLASESVMVVWLMDNFSPDLLSLQVTYTV